ncbi:Type IV secretion system protein virB4 [bacterium HR34]|nr:Type IV secretion system protein virB4 [bacterium HR34]
MDLPFLKNLGQKDKKKKTIEEVVVDAANITLADIIAPPAFEVYQNYIKFGERLSKTFFIFSYPRYLTTGWFSPVVNLDVPFDVSIHIFPIDTTKILKQLRKKVAEIELEIAERAEKGYVRDPALETTYQDLETLRDQLQRAQERMFRVGVYITIYGENPDDLRNVETTLRAILESRLIYIKPAVFQQKEGFDTTLPYGLDKLVVHTALNTSTLSSMFPFVSFDLSTNEGILYGINIHNNSLVLFDRFNLENANSTVFAKSGSGKSYAVKLEVLRYAMVGVNSIIIDPENEYRNLAKAVGGVYLDFSLSAKNHINPFDLPPIREDERPEDVLRSNIINLVGLLKIMLGGLTPEEDAIIDRALTETYAVKDITPNTPYEKWQENVPLMQDLEEVLSTMEGAESLVRRLRKFTKGTYANFFNQPTNIQMEDKPVVVFGIRDMEDELRPMAMYVIMRYIWNQIRAKLKKRILIVDEAWWMMQTEEGAAFLYGMVKRARKYWLGVTTITQDVGDFLTSSYGQPIITNSSLQLLLKQSPATIDLVKKVFNLTDAEKYLLLEADLGEGIFFAGQQHVAIKVVASPTEHKIITTNPEELVSRDEGGVI